MRSLKNEKIMKPKKIVFVFGTMNAGGSERVALTYLRQLKSSEYSISLVKIYKSTSELEGLIPQGTNIINLEAPRLLKAVLPLLKVLKKIKPDYIYIVQQMLCLLLPLYKPFLPKTHFIARMQSMPTLMKKQLINNSLEYVFWSIGMKYADTIIAQTEFMKDEAIKELHIKPRKIVVQYNPVDIEYIQTRANEEPPPFNNDKINALCSGRMDAAKGFDVLLKALPDVIKVLPRLHITIIGKNSSEGNVLKKLACELSLENYVSFAGHKENPYIYYKNCDMYILSSRREGFPNTLIENYCFNTPTVAACCVPIIKKFVKDGINGYLCEPDNPGSLADAIIKCAALKREDITNLPYYGSKLEDILNEL